MALVQPENQKGLVQLSTVYLNAKPREMNVKSEASSVMDKI